MSRKKRREEAPMPTPSAGLLRFYQEETASGVKFRPEIVVILAVVLTIGIILANLLSAGRVPFG